MAENIVLKATGNKLWRSEGRLFNECFIYLNKSTTKYLIIGTDPVTFGTLIYFCDRSTGNYVTIKKDEFDAFTQHVKNILYDGPKHDTIQVCDANFTHFSENIWKLQNKNKPGSILVHKKTFENFMRIEHLILREVISRDGGTVDRMITTMTVETECMSKNEFWNYIHEEWAESTYGSQKYQILSDLICKSDSFITLPMYKKLYKIVNE
jgi:hypothetical protein